MPLVTDPGSDYGVRLKYRVNRGTVIHQGDRAYFPISDGFGNRELLKHPDVDVLTDTEVEELEQRLSYPLPPQSENSLQIHSGGESVGLGDVVAKVTHKLGIAECAGCKKRRRWLNRIPVEWSGRK